MSEQNEHGIGHYAALKTAIANGQEESVKELLSGEPIQELEKNYLIDVAKLGHNRNIIKMLEVTPVKA